MKLLLHTCCGPCSLGTIFQLKNDFELTGFFFNPNIAPKDEFLRRIEAFKKSFKHYNLPYVIDSDYTKHKGWRDSVKGLEFLKENSERCLICYEFRLKETAILAKELGFEYFATTLTVGPTKKAEVINEIGKKLEKEYNVKFLEGNFKKNNGWNESIRLSKELNIYRQHYCGCEFSLRDALLIKRAKSQKNEIEKEH